MLLLIGGTAIALVIISVAVLVGDSGLVGELPDKPGETPSAQVAEIATPQAKEAAREARAIVYRKIDSASDSIRDFSPQDNASHPANSLSGSNIKLDEHQFKELVTELRDRGYEIATSDRFEAFLEAKWLVGERGEND